MKKIDILYDMITGPQQKQLAEQLVSCLKSHGYQATAHCTGSTNEVYAFIQACRPENCQLVITLNMTGFNTMTTENNTALNNLPMNIINYLDLDPKLFDYHLQKRVNYTMAFAVPTTQAADYIRHTYPHIYSVICMPSLCRDLPEYLDQMDWRF